MQSRETIAASLAAAERECREHGVRLTAIRKEVLNLILQHDRPVGAYEILEKLRATRHNAAPPTVYRALDFLLARGLIHRLERLAAYVACAHTSHADERIAPRHKVQFLICMKCQHVTEICGGEVEKAIAHIVQEAAFTRQHSVVEIEGICVNCASNSLS